MNQSNAVAAIPAAQPFSLAPQSLDEAFRFADMLATSDLVPKDFQRKPGNILVAMQWGAEVGLKPLQALQNIAVINGRPSLWGDAVIALARSSPVCEYVIEQEDGDTAVCRVKRRGEPEQVRTFSAADAKIAGLAGKAGPWTQYPRRMRQMRARAFALRDVFPDVLKGLPVAEELIDMQPTERHMGAAEVVTPAGKPEMPAYSAADFDKNLPAWAKLVANGKKEAPALLAMLSTKATFSEQQKAQILSLKKAEPEAMAEKPVDDFVAQYDAAEDGAK